MEIPIQVKRRAPPVGWRDVVFPREHGGWSLAFEPVALGLLAAPSPGGVWLALAVAAAFLARRPARIAWGGEGAAGRRSPARRAVLGLGLLAAVSLGGVVWERGGECLVWLMPSAAAGALFIRYDWRGEGREVVPEVAGALAFAMVTAVFGILSGWGTAESVALAVVMCARAVPTVLIVRAALRAAKADESHASPALALAMLGMGAGALLAGRGFAPWLAVVALAGFAARGFALLVFPKPVLRARTLGLAEAILGCAFVIAVGLAWPS